ncbi:MAG: PDZ domain-containing protein [Candidatus Omnitrophota bacterium]
MLLLGFLISPFSSADTLILKNGDKIKGLILEEFKDRVVFSTVDGEKEFMKSVLSSAVYDSEEKALLRKGSNQFKRGQYVKAYYTYKLVAELNPDLEEARERLYYLRSYIDTKDRRDILEDVASKKERDEQAPGITPARMVEEELGLVLEEGERHVLIKEIKENSLLGKDLEIKPGDCIVSVRGEMTAYMGINEVAEILLIPGEVRVATEREIFLKLKPITFLFDKIPFNRYRQILEAELMLQKQGIIFQNLKEQGVAETAGVRKNDLLFRINGLNVRYVPLAKVMETIENNQGREIDLIIRRNVTLWRKGKKHERIL